jgi:nucleotide-binding universal stress UspA family protein
MAFLSRILAPVEFSERCAAAARYAGALAAHFGSELVLVHVIPPAPPGMADEVYARATAEAKEKIEAFLAADLAGCIARRMLTKGDPARKIVQLALNEKSDIILMPTHGFGLFRRFLLGSNTAKVLHDADCPVWTGIHMEEAAISPPIPFRHILCAVDLGPLSANVLAWAATLQKEFDSRLTLMHVTLAAPGKQGVSGNGSEAGWEAMVRTAVEKELDQLRNDAHAGAEILVETGEPAQVIAQSAQRLNADLVVIGRGSAGADGNAFGRLRANAYAIIRQSPCPVVSV